MFTTLPPFDAEWLEADCLDGFANDVSSSRTRRHQTLPLTSTPPPGGRIAFVSGFDAEVETPGGTFAIPSQGYAPDVGHPDGVARWESFNDEPWLRWTWPSDDLTIEQEIFVVHGKSAVFVAWKLVGKPHGSVTLNARPLFSIRDACGMQHENGASPYEPSASFEHVVWRQSDGAPGVVARSNGRYRHEPTWGRSFLQSEEAARELDGAEDLALSPGTFHWDLAAKPAVWLFAPEDQRLNPLESTEELYVMTRRTELARRKAFEPLGASRRCRPYEALEGE